MHSRLGVLAGLRLPSHFCRLNTRTGLPQNIPSWPCGYSPPAVHAPLSSPSFCALIDGILAIMGVKLKKHFAFPLSHVATVLLVFERAMGSGVGRRSTRGLATLYLYTLRVGTDKHIV